MRLNYWTPGASGTPGLLGIVGIVGLSQRSRMARVWRLTMAGWHGETHQFVGPGWRAVRCCPGDATTFDTPPPTEVGGFSLGGYAALGVVLPRGVPLVAASREVADASASLTSPPQPFTVSACPAATKKLTALL